MCRAAAMCHNATRGVVPCTQCKNSGSPTLPNYPNSLFTCNAGCNSALHGNQRETWIDGHRRAYPNQPSLYSEIEVSDPQWSDVPARGEFQATKLAYEATRFVADGGSGTNYWMWFGGTNFNGGSNMPTTFMWGAPLGSLGQPNQPVYDHIGRMHRLFVSHEATLTGQPVPERHWIAQYDAYSRSYQAVGTAPSLTFWVNYGSVAVSVPQQPGLLVIAPGGVVVTDGSGTKVLFNTSDTETATAAAATAPMANAQQSEATLHDWQYWQEPLPGNRLNWTGPPATVASEFPLNDLQIGAKGLTDYISYSANFTAQPDDGGVVDASVALTCSLTLLVSDATTVYTWLDGVFLQTAGVLDNSQHNSDWKTFVLELPGGLEAGSSHRFNALTMNLGFNDDWPMGSVYPHMGENSRKGLLNNATVSCTAGSQSDSDAVALAAVAPPTAGEPLTTQECGTLTVQPITEQQAWLLPTPAATTGLVRYQSKTTKLCLGVAAVSSSGMPPLQLATCSAQAMSQQWSYNSTTRLLSSAVRSCTGGPECVLSELGSGGYAPGDSVVLYGKHQGAFGTNQLLSVQPSPTGVATHQLRIDVAKLCVTAGGSKHPLPPPPPPPPPPGRALRGWVQLNGTVGEWHRLFMPSAADEWSGWAAVRDGSATPISSRPMLWLRGDFQAPPQLPGDDLPLALRTGNATAGATKGRAWVNGRELGQYWSRGLGAGHAPCGPQLYLIPRDYLRADGGNNTLILFEEVGLVGLSALEAISVVRAAQAWG